MGVSAIKNYIYIYKYKYVCSRFLCCVHGLISLSLWFFLICGLVQALFLVLMGSS
jgi:hypothetical protein